MDHRYPIGRFQVDEEITTEIVKNWINDIEKLPQQLSGAVKNLDNEQLDTPYRPGGWTIRQVVHHVADSHLNAYVRFKLALTEDNPVIKPYDEGKWAVLPDYQLPIEISLTLLVSLHRRMVEVLRSLSPSDLCKKFVHPESGDVSVGKNIGLYAWHGKHHLAHIVSLCERKEWNTTFPSKESVE